MSAEYTLVRKRIRNIYIHVKPDGRVLVTAPYYAALSDIESFVESKEEWIEKTRKKIENIPALKPREYTKADYDRLLGKLNQFLPRYAEMTGLYPSRVSIKKMTTRWGSCNPQSRAVHFAVMLVDTPDEFIEYVVLHELCHLKYRSHGVRFWALVERYMPDYKDRKKLAKDPGMNEDEAEIGENTASFES